MNPNAFDPAVTPVNPNAVYLATVGAIDELSTAYNELVTKAAAARRAYEHRVTSANCQNRVAKALYGAAMNLAHSIATISDKANLPGVASCWDGTVEWLQDEIKRCN